MVDLGTFAAMTSAVLSAAYPFPFPQFLSSIVRGHFDLTLEMGDINPLSSLLKNLQKITINPVSSVLKNLEKVYQCPVCLSLPVCNIYQCTEGHLVCKDCHDKMPTPISCPTCKSQMPSVPMRCRTAEQVTTRVSYRYHN